MASAQNEPMDYTIRQATAVDIELLDLIYTENMKGYVEKNYPWKPQLFRESFSCHDYQVIEINNRIIGFMKVVWSETEIYLAEIQIAKNYQNQGIGTSLIQLIIEKARENNQKLWLKVLKGNPAKQLYQRLGFTKLEESLTHEIMVKIPY